MGQKVYNFAD